MKFFTIIDFLYILNQYISDSPIFVFKINNLYIWNKYIWYKYLYLFWMFLFCQIQTSLSMASNSNITREPVYDCVFICARIFPAEHLVPSETRDSLENCQKWHDKNNIGVSKFLAEDAYGWFSSELGGEWGDYSIFWRSLRSRTKIWGRTWWTQRLVSQFLSKNLFLWQEKVNYPRIFEDFVFRTYCKV
jgi:hypothetical protein